MDVANENNEINIDKTENHEEQNNDIKDSEKKDDKPDARAERRRKKEEENEKAAEEAKAEKKSVRKTKQKLSLQKLPEDKAKKIKKLILIAAAVIITILVLKPLISFLNTKENPNQPKGLLLLTDMTGYTEKDAIDDIHEIGFVNIKKEYIYDQFTQDGCVIKTNHHINSELKPDEEIIVYICDKSLIQTNEPEDMPNTTQGTDRTYFSMNGITIVDMAIKENTFYAILKNNNKEAIKDIHYRIGYQDSAGSDIGENKYELDCDFTVLPGEKFRISTDIRNDYAYYLYVSGLTYNKIETPETERN